MDDIQSSSYVDHYQWSFDECSIFYIDDLRGGLDYISGYLLRLRIDDWGSR